MNVRDKKSGAKLFWAMAVVAFLALVSEGVYMGLKNGSGVGIGDGNVINEVSTTTISGGTP